ncbi:unnamed protein product [Hapterophycus canaliculatus]
MDATCKRRVDEWSRDVLYHYHKLKFRVNLSKSSDWPVSWCGGWLRLVHYRRTGKFAHYCRYRHKDERRLVLERSLSFSCFTRHSENPTGRPTKPDVEVGA